MSIPSGAIVAHASATERVAYLRRVLTTTLLGLGLSTGVSLAFMPVLFLFPGLLSRWAAMGIILGSWAVTNFVAAPMVHGNAKWAGFVLGTGAQGLSMSLLLTMAAVVSMASYGNPFVLAGLALGLTFFAGLGMAAYTWSAPRDFSLIGAGLSALGLPMLLLMGVSFAFPSWFGGAFGIGLSVLFVGISAAGLLYQLNQVIHQYRTNMHIEGAYTITIGLLVLYWNILTLLMRLNRR